MRRREELLRAYERSGLTQAGFARREGIKYATFVSWVCGRRGRAGPPLAPCSGGRMKFTEVSLPAVAGHKSRSEAVWLSVTLPGALVVGGADAVAVAGLVKALRS